MGTTECPIISISVVLSKGVKWSWSETDHLTPFIVEVKNEWTLPLFPLCTLMSYTRCNTPSWKHIHSCAVSLNIIKNQKMQVDLCLNAPCHKSILGGGGQWKHSSTHFKHRCKSAGKLSVSRPQPL